MWFVLGAMALYSSFTLFVLGFYFHRFSEQLFPDVAPLDVVNRYALATFVSLFFIRFLFQKTPRMKITPYLHLPVERKHLVAFFQATSLLSIHNVYPMLFFVPFWFTYVRGTSSIGSEVLWLVAIGGVLATSHFGNLFLRGVLRRRASWFYVLMVIFILTTFIDETAGLG